MPNRQELLEKKRSEENTQKRKENTTFRKCVCLVWKLFPDPVGVFCTLLEAPNCHIAQNPIFDDFRYFPYIFPIHPLKGLPIGPLAVNPCGPPGRDVPRAQSSEAEANKCGAPMRCGASRTSGSACPISREVPRDPKPLTLGPFKQSLRI